MYVENRDSHGLLRVLLFTAAVLVATSAKAADNGAGNGPIWLAVTKEVFLEAVKPLAAKRTEDGFKTVVSTRDPAEALAALKRRPAFLLLIGDEQPGRQEQPWYIPTNRRKLYRWRTVQKPDFASDALWGDFDADLKPDIPVGRIPARTPEQLKLIVDKILKFEARVPTPEDLCLPIWVGAAGYNPALDSMTTMLLLNIIQTNAPSWARPWIISGDPPHPLCGWPEDQPAIFSSRLQQGGFMAVLMGHATARSFHSMSFYIRSFDDAVRRRLSIVYSVADVETRLLGDKPSPPTVILACSAGSFTEGQNCLAESLLLQPAGPVAAIGATTESHPLTNYFSGLCLLQQTNRGHETLGSIWLTAQRAAAVARDFVMEPMLVNVEGKPEEKMNVAALRRDQALMYALLGDPATRLFLPRELDATVEHSTGTWRWEARKPKGATRLYVGLRAAGQTLPNAGARTNKNTARKLFEQANDTFAFSRLAEFGADKAWKGVVDKEGTLRLVATAPGRIYAAAFVLKPPD